jgi:hypothetical protein
MGGTAQAQARDSANRFTRTTPDPDATPHPCERLARSLTGEGNWRLGAERGMKQFMDNAANVAG